MTREMKNSGIEWIGEIPADWKILRLKNVGNFSSSGIDKNINEDEELVKIINYVDVYNNKTHELYNDDYMVVSATAEKINIHCVKKGDLIFTPSSETIEDIGISALVKEDLENTAFSYHVLRFQFEESLYENYKKYLCNNHFVRSYFSKCATGTIRKTLNRDDFKNAIVFIPPLTEQKKIADFLDSKVSEIDKMIAETKSSIENYKEYRKSIIAEATIKGINKNAKMKESGIQWLGTIPENRNVITPKALFALRKEKAIEGERQLTASQQHGVIYQDEYMELTGTRVVTVAKDFDILKHVEKGDFVISMRSFQGGIEYSENTGSISSAYVMLIPNLEYVYPPFFKWLLKSSAYINALQSTSNLVRDGQAMRYSNFAQVPLFTVPLDEQKEIAEFLDAKTKEIDNLISEKEALVSNLEEYKKSLIYEYVTGKKAVSSANNNETVIVAPIYPAVYNTKKARFAQAVLMSKILATSNNNKGRVKLEKTLYTIEHHIGFDFETEYTRDAAGPLDNSLYKCETIISSINKWFNISSSNYGVSYKPTKNVNKYKNYYNNYFADYNTEIERIIGIFDNFDTDQAEIIATLYGAWNDFVIDNKTYTDEDVVNEVLNNWHDSKKRFAKDVWLRATDKMRTLDLIPKGYGKKTIYKEV